MQPKNRKKAGIFTAGGILLLGLLAFLLYQNRQRFTPKVKEISYLQADLEKDTALVMAGIQVRNRAPFSFKIDSVSYHIRNNGSKLGWGSQVVGKLLPALQNKVFDFSLKLDKDRYKRHLKNQQQHDSLELEVFMQVFVDPPLLRQQVFSVNRTVTTAIPKAPALKIDSLVVKSFSPDSGYNFLLHVNTGNSNLPQLEIANLTYSIRLADSITINGKVDSAFRINKGEQQVVVPVHLATAEMIDLLRIKLCTRTVWPYKAQASAELRSAHPLFESTQVAITKTGKLNAKKISAGSGGLPTVKAIQTLQLVAKEKQTYLQANVLLHNPGKLPLYIDSARYEVRHQGQLVASGGSDPEKVLPAQQDQSIALQLAVNNKQYKRLSAKQPNQTEIPLDVALTLHYYLPEKEQKQIVIKKQVNVPATKSPTFEVKDILIKQLEPETGAQLVLQVEVQNQEQSNLQLDNLNYRLLLKKNIEISGQTQKVIEINPGTSQVEIPVDLSAEAVNQLAKGLMQGVESWEYTFNGTATLTAANSILQQTEISLKTSGVHQIRSKGTPDFMPEISKIDTLSLTIHYDTAWVHMYAAIYNTLPVKIHVTELQVDVIHKNDTIGKTEEKLDLYLAPNTNSFAWHTLGVYFGVWEEHVKRYQHQDSLQLQFPATLSVNLGNLGKQQVDMDLNTKIPTPATPVTLLQRLKLRGFGFRSGLQFDALVAVQNVNTKDLTIKNIEYQVQLENGVDICGQINRTYQIPLGISEVPVPVNLSVWEALKLFTRQVFGPPLLDYKINATAQVSTQNPKLKNVFVIFENHNQSNLKEKKTLKQNL